MPTFLCFNFVMVVLITVMLMLVSLCLYQSENQV